MVQIRSARMIARVDQGERNSIASTSRLPRRTRRCASTAKSAGRLRRITARRCCWSIS